MNSFFAPLIPYVWSLVIGWMLCLQLAVSTHTESSDILADELELVQNVSSKLFLRFSNEPSLNVRVIRLSNSASPRDILLLGVVLGALAMRCAMMDHQLQRTKAYIKSQASSIFKAWAFGGSTESSEPRRIARSIHSRRSEDATYEDDIEIPRSMAIVEATNQHTLAEEHVDYGSEVDEINLDSPTQQTSLNEHPIEAIDSSERARVNRYQPRSNIKNYKIACGTEWTKAPKLITRMWGLLYSVDSVLRPIHNTSSPEIEYQPMNPDLYSSTTYQESLFEDGRFLEALDLVLGRFAARQDNINLLKKVYNESSWPLQHEIWQLIKIAIQYNGKNCFNYLLTQVRCEDRGHILEFCAYHNRIHLTREALDKWTEFVRTDTANIPLVVAAYRGNLDLVRYLLTRCTDVEVTAESLFTKVGYTTPVMAALAHGHAGIVRELRAAGARLRKDGSTEEKTDPFVIALENRNAAMLAVLIDAESSILEGRDQHLETILEIAVAQENPQLARLILERDQVWRNEASGSLFLSACQGGYLEIIHAFIEGQDMQLVDGNIDYHRQNSPIRQLVPIFLRSARERHELIMNLLKENWLFYHRLPIPPSTSIISDLACLGDSEGLKLLLSQEPNADLNCVDSNGNSPLFRAMFNHMRRRNREIEGHVNRWLSTVRLLLARGARLNLQDGSYWATKHGGIPKELLNDLRQLSRRLKNDRKDFTANTTRHESFFG